MKKNIQIFMACYGFLLLFPLAQKAFAQRSPSNPVYVEYTQVKLIDKKEQLNAVGILLPAAQVMVKPELAGKIIRIHFKEGQYVKQQDILIELDAVTLEANVKDANAKVFLAQQNLKRLQAVKGSSTEQQIDISKAALLQAEANLDIVTAQLEKTKIKAPFDGIVGLSNVEVGEYLQVGADLVSLVNQSRLKLEFTIPEHLAHLIKPNQSVHFQLDNFPNQTFEGKIYAISPEIDQAGRAITIRAWVDNPNMTLIPGLFARLNIDLPSSNKILQLPEESMFAQNGKQWVYAVKTSNQKQFATLTEIKVISRQHGLITIEADLKPNDIIVKSGQQNLRDKAQIINIDAPLKNKEKE